MQVKRTNNLERKADTRKKIMMGGLFAKAGLDHYHQGTPHLLYGMLLHCRKMLDDNDKAEGYFAELGQELIRGE